MRYIIVTGSPVDGFQFFGTFEDRDEAVHEAESFLTMKIGGLPRSILWKVNDENCFSDSP